MEICEHCGRPDVGSAEAGRATIRRPRLDPYTNRPVGYRTMVVCCPTTANRPVCDRLVRQHGHRPNCVICYSHNPPRWSSAPLRLRSQTRIPKVSV